MTTSTTTSLSFKTCETFTTGLSTHSTILQVLLPETLTTGLHSLFTVLEVWEFWRAISDFVSLNHPVHQGILVVF